MESQHQNLLDDLTDENERLKQDYVTEKQFRDQLVMEINKLRKQAIERDTQFYQLLGSFTAEGRKKKQLAEQIAQLKKLEFNQKVKLATVLVTVMDS